VQRLIEAIQTAARNGLAVLIVEQQVHTVLAASNRAYLLKQPRGPFTNSTRTPQRASSSIRRAW
jgi:ABC-type branched-subunit amino acid transport system ATPase component